MNDHKRLHTLTFAVRPAAGARADEPLRFEGVAYSGGVVPAFGWHGDVVIDLSGLKNADGEELPVLVDHQASVEAIAGKGRIWRFRQPDGTTSLCNGFYTVYMYSLEDSAFPVPLPLSAAGWPAQAVEVSVPAGFPSPAR